MSLLFQTLRRVSQGIDPASQAGDMPVQRQIMPLDKSGVDLPAVRSQDSLDPRQRPEDHPFGNGNNTAPAALYLLTGSMAVLPLLMMFPLPVQTALHCCQPCQLHSAGCAVDGIDVSLNDTSPPIDTFITPNYNGSRICSVFNQTDKPFISP
jgi:hypothetical protein